MLSIKQVSEQSGVSRRTLQYYDNIGLLKATEYTQSGYRLYDNSVFEKLQQILIFKELEFSLNDIKKIVSSPAFDKKTALSQQIELLKIKKEHLEKILNFAEKLKESEEYIMDFTAFDSKVLEDYSKRAKEKWGDTKEYKEYESKGITSENTDEFMKIFVEFGNMKLLPPDSKEIQNQVKILKDYITEHYYNCSNEILLNLGQMYVYDEEFKSNIDYYAGNGTAELVNKAINIFVNS